MMAEFVRGAHHLRYTPDPHFVRLCDLAERVGLRVELDVSAFAFGAADARYRNVVAIMVRSDDPAFDVLNVTVRYGPGDSLRAMATRARAELESRLS